MTYHVDRLVVGTTNRVRSVASRPGGKGANVARVLHALGAQVRVVAPVGDVTGAEFGEALNGLGIASDLVPCRVPTRRTVAVVDDAGSATMLTEPAAIDCWPAFVAATARAMVRADVVVISGSVPSGAPDDAMSTLVGMAHDAGRPVLVDTSGAALRDALRAAPSVVKPNADELASVSGGSDPVVAAQQLARAHGTTVVASLGASGVVAATPDASWSARPSRPLVGNPTGAGDALVAGLATGMRDGVALPEMLVDAVALAAACVLAPHAGEIDVAHYRAECSDVVVQELQ